MKFGGTVRYGELRAIGRLFARFSGLQRGDRCIARTERGIEVGDIISPVQVADEADEAFGGEILRKMTEADRQRYQQIKQAEEPKEFESCQEKIREQGLPMKLCAVEHLFGDGKIIFYFYAQGRVDFRALVRELAQQYNARIDMHQIGVRDEARILAHYEHCGRELCCRTFIKQLEPVTMKMAKNQKATLDPTKISGRCGRLMCCLRFEDAIYEELRALLPRKGAKVSTKEGTGLVVSVQILDQTVAVELEGGREKIFPGAEVQVIEPAAPEPETPAEAEAEPEMPMEPEQPEPEATETSEPDAPG